MKAASGTAIRRRMGGLTDMEYLPDAGIGYSFSINPAMG